MHTAEGLHSMKPALKSAVWAGHLGGIGLREIARFKHLIQRVRGGERVSG
jgi:hypothetical protein